MHNITERDGLFTVRQPAWHGLGTVLADYPTRDEAKKIAHPWEPVTEPLYRVVKEAVHADRAVPNCPHGSLCAPEIAPDHWITKSKAVRVEDFDLVVRDDDGFALGVKPDSRTLVTNDEMYDIAEALMKGEGSGKVLYETGGSVKGGRKVWLLMRFEEPFLVGGRSGTETIAYYGLQNAHDGSGAFRGQGTNVTIVCHEAGTPILHEGRWIKVEEHPSFMGMKSESGLQVSIEGLPFTETVTLDHRYRTVRGEWVEARDLVKGESEIAYPIPAAGQGYDLMDGSDDLWWAIGLWWGDGHLHGTKQVTWTVADTDKETEERLLGWLRTQGFTGKGSQKQGCRQITATLPDLHDFLSTWYTGEGRGKGKRMKSPTPVVCEQLSVAQAAQVADGYFTADGSLDTRGGKQWTSTNLEGLLVLRDLLLKQGVVSSIRQMRRETTREIVAGHEATVRPNWTLRVSPNPQGLRIEDGVLYSKVRLVEWVKESKFVPITTEDHTYMTRFGQSHNCDNTSQMADMDAKARGTEFVFRHTKNVAERVEEAKEALAGWKASVETYQRLAEHLIDAPINREQRRLFVHEFIPMPQENLISPRVRENVTQGRMKLLNIFDSPTQETIKDTAWGLVQGAIEYSQWYRKAKTAESRFQRAYLDRSRLTTDALQLAMEVSKA